MNDYLLNLDPDTNYFDAQDVDVSKTVTIQEYIDLCAQDNSCLRICGQNIRSFNRNFDDFSSSFNDFLPDVMVFSETWFDEANVQYIQNYNSFHTIRTANRSGGVSILVKNSISCQKVAQLCFANQSIEISTVKIHLGSSSIFVLGIYRPHSDSIENFTVSLSEILDNRIFRNSTCVIIGDMDINLFLQNSS